jgi:hypothetical protein
MTKSPQVKTQEARFLPRIVEQAIDRYLDNLRVLDLSHLDQSTFDTDTFVVGLIEVISAAVSRGMKVVLPNGHEAIFPLLETMIELCLELERAFTEGRRCFDSLVPGSEEIPDETVEVDDGLGGTKTGTPSRI